MSNEQNDARMKRRFGMSRRDLLRRGAIVGGTLIWTIPVVKTISSAGEGENGSPVFGCCECRTAPNAGQNNTEKCTGSGLFACTTLPQHTDNATTCRNFCDSQSTGFTHWCLQGASTPRACTAGFECDEA